MKESIILTQIINALRFHENCGELLFERTNVGVINAGYYTNKAGISKKRMVKTGRRGSSDIKVYCQNGITLHLEVKGDKEKQNENQKLWQAKLERLKHRYYVVRSVAEVEIILSEVKKMKLVDCHDCGAKPGEIHKDGCDTEFCSVCGGQRLLCDCKGHDKCFARWTGIWHGVAEAQYLGIDLNELHHKYRNIFFVKPKRRAGQDRTW